jgi:hypothetical protein
MPAQHQNLLGGEWKNDIRLAVGTAVEGGHRQPLQGAATVVRSCGRTFRVTSIQDIATETSRRDVFHSIASVIDHRDQNFATREG